MRSSLSDTPLLDEEAVGTTHGQISYSRVQVYYYGHSICVLDGRKSVSNGNGGATLRSRIECLLMDVF